MVLLCCLVHLSVHSSVCCLAFILFICTTYVMSVHIQKRKEKQHSLSSLTKTRQSMLSLTVSLEWAFEAGVECVIRGMAQIMRWLLLVNCMWNSHDSSGGLLKDTLAIVSAFCLLCVAVLWGSDFVWRREKERKRERKW